MQFICVKIERERDEESKAKTVNGPKLQCNVRSNFNNKSLADCQRVSFICYYGAHSENHRAGNER